MHLTMALLGWISESLARTTEVMAYTLHAAWVTIVRGSIALMEAIDDLVPDIYILDNPLLRLLVMGAVGFFIGVVLMIFVSFITGNWGIPCVFVLAIGFCMFVGLVADPEAGWSIGDFPGFSGRGGPKMPLNL